jgi:hypothetical protein
LRKLNLVDRNDPWRLLQRRESARDVPAVNGPRIVALQTEPIAVILDLVKPIGAGRDGGRSGGEAELKRLSMRRRFALQDGNANPRAAPRGPRPPTSSGGGLLPAAFWE